MDNNSTFNFIVDKENKTIKIQREFESTLPLVWDAYTKSELLDQWWAPKPWKARTKKMDFKEGGQWLYAMEGPNGEVHWSVATYKSINFQKSYVGVDAFTDEDGNVNNAMPESKWEVSFTDKGNTTLVEINNSFDDVAQLEAIINMGFKEGLSAAMENLDRLLISLKI